MDNLRGIFLMVASMLGFAFEDMFIKFAAADLPTGQILMMLSGVGSVVFALAARAQGARFIDRNAWHAAVVWRNLGEIIATWGFITALTLTTLSGVSAILQAMPLAVTCGAALFLGESVGWRRWIAILIGFVGVLIILRPGADTFQPASLWAVLAVFGLTIRDLATRRIPGHISTMQVAAWGFASVGLLGAVMLGFSGGAALPTSGQTVLVGCALAFGILAYWAIVQAMRIGETSVITPFRYARLVFALIIGGLAFNERPDAWMLIGSAIVVATGLYTFARERRLRRQALSIAAATG